MITNSKNIRSISDLRLWQHRGTLNSETATFVAKSSSPMIRSETAYGSHLFSKLENM
ncbi:hypothetical protein SAMN05216297_10268 [Flavobacterium phragmitis]|uniref:Uncharacterized protein n=1 Tax=Flavobacterium phragmitis TaxID=739143 RepID=A0A1I1LRB6_9FLAO|nr:hypothetical protein SAMN05216297_10268 [Flavobacterium phragmitis]